MSYKERKRQNEHKERQYIDTDRQIDRRGTEREKEMHIFYIALKKCSIKENKLNLCLSSLISLRKRKENTNIGPDWDSREFVVFLAYRISMAGCPVTERIYGHISGIRPDL